MKNLINEYTQKYGIAEKAILSDLGGDIEKIIEAYESIPEYPFEPTMDVFSDADNIHNMVEREIQTRYFRQISREAAVAICNTLLIGDGTIKIYANLSLEYSCSDFMWVWNEANGDKDKIIAPVVFDN